VALEEKPGSRLKFIFFATFGAVSFRLEGQFVGVFRSPLQYLLSREQAFGGGSAGISTLFRQRRM
jgi:hypothetical protein